ncbi:MAG: hypothetical protein ACREJC_11640, partial [Tepidisphaeraceae bacterium]
PGFRVRAGGSGRVWGPYLPPDKFKMRGMDILDQYDNPVLYFPASAAKPNINLANGFLRISPTPPTSVSRTSLYEPWDNLIAFNRDTPPNWTFANNRLAAMLGDFDNGAGGPPDGRINSGETAATTGPFLLWSAGPDGQFGPNATVPTRKDASACDDVTNFR